MICYALCYALLLLSLSQLDPSQALRRALDPPRAPSAPLSFPGPAAALGAEPLGTRPRPAERERERGACPVRQRLCGAGAVRQVAL